MRKVLACCEGVRKNLAVFEPSLVVWGEKHRLRPVWSLGRLEHAGCGALLFSSGRGNGESGPVI